MIETAGQLLPVSGAQLYYRAVGTGPVLLLLPGGDGDADAFASATSGLAERFRVVTLDRRGLSRSVLEEGAQEISIERHADDAHAVLAALGATPAYVFGGSIGALIGLALVTRHPGDVRALIAFEPPAPGLLSSGARERAAADQLSVQAAFRTGGVGAAMQRFAQITAVNPADCEADLPAVVPSVWRPRNLQFFLTHDGPAVARYHLDMAKLRRSATRILAAAGRTSGGAWPRQAAEALAAQLPCPLIELAGDHAGFVRHPRALVETLRSVFVPPAATPA